MRFTLAACLTLLAGCAGLDDPTFHTGSSTLVASDDAIFVVDTDGGALVRQTPEGEVLARVELGGEPTRVARVDGRLYVSLRAAGELAVIDEATLEVLARVPVGAEPVGVVAAEDGDAIWVAVSLQGEVVRVDPQTLAVAERVAVGGEPKWLALHPGGKHLYVAFAVGAEIAHVVTATGAVDRIELPRQERQGLEDGASFVAGARVTGDIAISPDGRDLALPVLYVDNTTAVPDPDEPSDFDEQPVDGYAAGGGARFDPNAVVMPLTGGVAKPENAWPMSLGGFDEEFMGLRGYAGSLTWSEDGDHLFATLEGASAVLGVRVQAPDRRPDAPMIGDVPMADVGFDGSASGSFVTSDRVFPETMTWLVPAGPRGVALLPAGEVAVHSFLDRQVALLDAAGLPTRPAIAPLGMDRSFEGGTAMRPLAAAEYAPESLPEDIALGRRLFYAADDSRMAAQGAGVSCATCHADGRADGFTWTFRQGERQTPSLAGVVSLTAPVTWTDAVPTVMQEVEITSQGRMGGDGLREADALAVAAFVDWTREPLLPEPDAEAVARGAELFASEEVGCADCHHGIAWTDHEQHDLYGLDAVQTRGLVGVAASAPYLHDGSAPTLRAVLTRSRDGSMGDTSGLSDAQLNDLEAFLRSL